MRHSWALKLIWGLVSVTVLACTNTTPTFSVLDQNAIPQPQFNGSTLYEVTSLTATQTYAITGQCDPKITGLVAVPVGSSTNFANSASLTTSGFSINCSTSGQFSFTLQSLTNLGFTIVDNTNYVIQLSAVTSAGLSNPSTIRVIYSKEGGEGPKRVLITSGGTTSTATGTRMASGSSFKAVIRVDHGLPDYSGTATTQNAMSKYTTSDGQFSMKMGAAAESD